ncbi:MULTISPECIES: MarR family winged helix-turn-helix transcriptional regulator [unclassified Pseudomonas]|uniref:MarR family winged helix-turn-helix transcriptional regulator n=1 Tax=unclassified Pseudomonas TaxID=196821 RepID=UPI000BD2AAD0|nr:MULTISPECIES: MarR family winged helix-turn-helix transcriptional regulator [unclassified Pseudomonas]PVZ20545.1 DNA-binding MarR family transcriptional regulator [Pseudomonas sp. URIL14HWK12:I12]PVZ27611.1 DNA-binding MarR family transcriptional regulator [Pseudomonas sp. URIL14HWK12:I10]PVZ38500.1 DNA-binding MarR family transcriptional regulator [Pseudomonas sp. URIL14HWK12:I11]SNZ03111.1 DNA-binding transcriptional regulator, MarR family [Pseudomonas sp. URIL14HWK12:I9]
MPASRNASGQASPEPHDLRDLVSFQLRQLSNLYTKNTASVYQRKFGLTMNEWRLIALLSTAGSLSLNRLAAQAQFDKGLTSRIVLKLTERGLVQRAVDPEDARGVALSLTAQGQSLVAEVFPEAVELNRQLQSVLTRKEREVLLQALEKLTHQARAMLDREREDAQQA